MNLNLTRKDLVMLAVLSLVGRSDDRRRGLPPRLARPSSPASVQLVDALVACWDASTSPVRGLNSEENTP
jgi:hypothetical protein